VRLGADGLAPVLTTQLTERSELAGADMLPVLQRLAAGLGLQVTWRKGGRAVLRGADGAV
jgi:hypothetical protein